MSNIHELTVLELLDEQLLKLENLADPDHPQYENLRDQVEYWLILRDELEHRDLETFDEDILMELLILTNVKINTLDSNDEEEYLDENELYDKCIHLYDYIEELLGAEDEQ